MGLRYGPPYNPWASPAPDARTQVMPVASGYYPQQADAEAGWGAGAPAMDPETAKAIISKHFGLTPVDPHSGMKETASEDDTTKLDSSSHKTTWLTPEEQQANAMSAAAIPQIQAAQASQDANKHLFELGLLQPHQADLASPLSIAAHNIDPHNAIIAPQQGAGMGEKEVREWAKQQQDDQRDLARLIISGENAARSGTAQEQIMQTLASKIGEEANDPFHNQRPNNFQNNDFFKWAGNVDKNMKEDQAAIGEGNQLISAIHGNSAAQAGIPIMMGKMLTGASRVPVQEALMERGDQAAMNRFMQKWSTLSEGTLTPQNAQEYTDFVNQLAALHKTGINKHVQQALSLGSSVGIDQNKMHGYLAPIMSWAGASGSFNRPNPKAAQQAQATPVATKPRVDINALFQKAMQEEKGND